MSSFALLRTTPRGFYPLGMTKKEGDPSANASGWQVKKEGHLKKGDRKGVKEKGSFWPWAKRRGRISSFFHQTGFLIREFLCRPFAEAQGFGSGQGLNFLFCHSERSASGVKNLLPYFLIEFLCSGQRFGALSPSKWRDERKTSFL